MEIWICDDNPQDAEELRGQIDRLSPGERITWFSAPADMLQAPLRCSLLFLDIRLRGESGLNVGWEMMRRITGLCLVYFTWYPEYAGPAWDQWAFQFCVKPISDDKLRRILHEVRVREDQRLFLYGKDASYNIPYRDILYVETKDKGVLVHTESRSYPSRRSLAAVEAELSPHGFQRIHKSFLVSLPHVISINKRMLKVVLVDGTVLDLSNHRVRDVENRLSSWRRK